MRLNIDCVGLSFRDEHYNTFSPLDPEVSDIDIQTMFLCYPEYPIEAREFEYFLLQPRHLNFLLKFYYDWELEVCDGWEIHQLLRKHTPDMFKVTSWQELLNLYK